MSKTPIGAKELANRELAKATREGKNERICSLCNQPKFGIAFCANQGCPSGYRPYNDATAGGAVDTGMKAAKKKGKIPYAGKVRGAREATYGNANSTKAKKETST